MSHRRSLKIHYFPGTRIANIKYCLVPSLMKQPKLILLHIGTNDVPFPENMFKKLKELRNFILNFLADVKLIFSTPELKIDK